MDDGHSDFDAFESVFQSLKGLSGGFLTMMDRQTLGQTIKHYTIEEDRNLLRYRLRLTDKQKKDLLKRLYLAKKNYNARYYFFPQNCASVLVKVISQGIGNEEIAHFDPFVSPPNTLVSLFIRNGLAVPVYPSFYSYRKKAYLAQDEIRVRYKELRSKKPELAWPDISPLFDDEESERLALLAPLRVLAEKNSELEEEFYLLANLIQEAEAAYGHKELICENYTSKVTAQARKLQESLLERMAEPSPFHTQRYLQKSHLKSEREAYEEGLPRTRLLSYGFGLGHYHSDSDDTGIMRVDATIEKQEMGSISSVAMQRGNSVSLGSLNLSLGKDSDGGVEVKSWGARALKIRKFQERLDYIPSYFSSAGSLGLGLTLLDFRGNKEQERLWGTLAGGEILFNLLSSRNNNDYAFVSLGADVVHQRNPIRNATGLALPIYTETLMSFGRKRETQWRNHFEYRPSVNDTLQDELILDTGLSRQMGHLGKQLVLLKMVLSYSKSIAKTQTGPGSSYMQTWVGLEMNPW